jgi:hypothetical protein
VADSSTAGIFQAARQLVPPAWSSHAQRRAGSVGPRSSPSHSDRRTRPRPRRAGAERAPVVRAVATQGRPA